MKNHINMIHNYSLSQLKKIFEIQGGTYIKDTWLWSHRFLEIVDFNQYRIIGFSFKSEEKGEAG